MMVTRYIKSFSKGQITIPKEFREFFGIGEEFWLKLSIHNGKIVAEPMEKETNKKNYKVKLLGIKGVWINPSEIIRNRTQIEKQIASRK